jgi:hypothetical protein
VAATEAKQPFPDGLLPPRTVEALPYEAPTLSTLPDDCDTANLDQLIVILTTLHLKSRPLLGLPPCQFMSKTQVFAWEVEKKKVKVLLKAALDSFNNKRDTTSELALVNAVLALL